MIYTLPVEAKFLGIRFIKQKEVGLEFNNMALFNFRNNTNVTNENELKGWVDKHGIGAMMDEMIFCAMQSHCMKEKVKEPLSKQQLLRAVAMSDEGTRLKIQKAWQNSLPKVDDLGSQKKNIKVRASRLPNGVPVLHRGSGVKQR